LYFFCQNIVVSSAATPELGTLPLPIPIGNCIGIALQNVGNQQEHQSYHPPLPYTRLGGQLCESTWPSLNYTSLLFVNVVFSLATLVFVYVRKYSILLTMCSPIDKSFSSTLPISSCYNTLSPVTWYLLQPPNKAPERRGLR
jgi:hypothetical protein